MNQIQDPTEIKLSQLPKDVVRTNKMPIFVVGAVFFAVVLFLLMRTEEKRQKREEAPVAQTQKIDIPNQQNNNRWFEDEKFKNLNLGKSQIINKPLSPKEEIEVTVSSQELAFTKAQLEQDYGTRVEILKMEQKSKLQEKEMELNAGKAGLAVDGVVTELPGAGGGGAIGRPGGGSGSIVVPVPASLGGGADQDVNGQDEKKQFIQAGISSGEYLPNLKKKAISPYEVKAGTYISASLITGINSDLPGSLVAQITENIYDTVSGRYLLIPQGAKIVGEYDSRVTFGQDRALVVWSRIIFPDGSSINLEKMQGVDVSGYAGFKDKVDRHYLRIYGNALLLSMMGAGYDLLNNRTNQNDSKESIAASVGQRLGEISGQTIERNLNVQPTIMIRPGYEFKVIVMKDMILEAIEDDTGS